MIPTQPIAEDEAAELGTLNILETRLAMLIKKADAVASKARQLNYHLKGRRTAVLSRKVVEQPGNSDPENRNFSPQPFSAVNSRSNGENAKIQQNLLDQFTSYGRRQSIPHGRPKASRVLMTDTPPFHHNTFNGPEPDTRRLSHPLTSSEDGTEGQYRVLMASKIEKLSRGDAIYPPCDRCRRLNFDCTKHLTACQACTKKHAKCAWKDIRDGELDHAPLMGGGSGVGGENGGGMQGAESSRYGSASLDGSLDPGSRVGAGSGAGAGENAGSETEGRNRHPLMVQRGELGNGEREREGEGGRERERGTGSEHAMLTQIAAAAGGR